MYRTLIIKLFFIISLIFIYHFVNAQPRVKGKINKFGFFECNSRKDFYSHIAHYIKANIDNETFSYFEGNNVKYVFSADNYSLNNNIFDFDKLSTKEVLKVLLSKKSPLPFNELNARKWVVKDSILNSLNNFSKEELFFKFIDKNGLIINVNNLELEKAIIYKLLSYNIPIYRNDISGNLVLSKNIISYKKLKQSK